MRRSARDRSLPHRVKSCLPSEIDGSLLLPGRRIAEVEIGLPASRQPPRNVAQDHWHPADTVVNTMEQVFQSAQSLPSQPDVSGNGAVDKPHSHLRAVVDRSASRKSEMNFLKQAAKQVAILRRKLG